MLRLTIAMLGLHRNGLKINIVELKRISAEFVAIKNLMSGRLKIGKSVFKSVG